MVKKKNIQVRTKQPSTCRATTPVSQIAESEALDPLKESTHHRAPAAPLELQTTDEIPQGFPDRVYLLAAAIFQNNHLQKPAAHRLVNYGKQRGLPLPEVKDEEMRRAAYELAFNTLKYQDLLEDIMIDSCLHLPPSIPDDEMSLAAVVLYDLQDRKFMPRRHHQGQTEEIIAEARSIENYLTGCSTKLAASLARCRIKHNVLSIHCILPRSVRIKQGRSNCLPHYAWVNTMKSSLDEVQAVLKSSGFSQVKSAAHLEGQSFCRDPHCGDLLVFPAGLKPRLNSTNLLTDHKLTIQDKFCSLGPNLVCSVLPARGDVLMVGHFSGLTVAHTASLVAWKHTTQQNSNNQSTVYVCVSGTEARRQEIQQVVTTMGCKNVKLMPGVFQSLDRAEKTLQRVRVILLTPRCSMSAVSDPVQFILQENGDTDLLQDLSQPCIAQSKLEALVSQQRKDIVHALRFPHVKSVVYSTCSIYPEENEKVVTGAVEEFKACSEGEGEPKPADFSLTPPTFISPDNAEAPEKSDLFFRLKPSDQSNGCFLAVLSREEEPVVKETPQEVLARAHAKGILDRIGSDQLPKKERPGRNNRKMKTAHACSPQSPPPLVQAKRQESLGKIRMTLNGQQSSPVKPRALRPKATNTTVSNPFSSEPDGCCTSFSKPEKSSLPKTMTVVLNTTSTSATTTLHPTFYPGTPVIRSRKPPQEVLKPVMLVLPPVHFPNFFPPQNRRTGFRPSVSRWRTQGTTGPLARSGGGQYKDLTMRSRLLF